MSWRRNQDKEKTPKRHSSFLLLVSSEQLDNLESEKEAVDWEEIKEQRTDERMVLESIYGDNFRELITNRVWTITLELENLRNHLQEQRHGAKGVNKRKETTALTTSKTKRKEICQFYQKGACRFGDRCLKSHVLQRDLEKQEALYQQPEKEIDDLHKFPFKVEVRFPEGNKYPLEAPFVIFSCSDDSLPDHSCLNFTSRFIEEAKELSSSGLPVVFSVISLLDDQTVIEELVAQPPHRYSLPEPILTPLQAQAEEDSQAHLYGSLVLPTSHDEQKIVSHHASDDR